MSEFALTPPRKTKTTIQQELLRRRAGADIATQKTATDWQPHSARTASSGLGRTGYGISRAHRALPDGITNYFITSDPRRIQ